MRISKLLFVAILYSYGICAQSSDDYSAKDSDTAYESTSVFDQGIERSPGITDPPDFPVRAMAEWEELQAITIAYDPAWPAGHLQALRDIAKEASTEVEVLVICELSTDKEDFIDDGISLENISFSPVGIDNVQQVWIRDYGPHTMYSNDVEDMLLIDWIYEEEFSIIDTIASFALAEYYNLPLYLTTESPLNLRLDGGNFLTDGLGTAFSSDRVMLENGEEHIIDNVMSQFMGIDTYIKFDRLQFDVIHHVDMHMKLLDEETILFGEYPEGISDWGRIEANIAYLQENFTSPFGTPYKIVRIPMPPDQNGDYPSFENTGCSAHSTPCYNTYTNALFVNKKILVPTYQQPANDNQALMIWQELMPGYTIIGIDCSGVIPKYGAIHCISKEIGSNDPLLIVHQKLKNVCDTDLYHRFEASVQHKSGIQEVNLFYKTVEESTFSSIAMEQLTDNIWEAEIESFPIGTVVEYYISATANSGKQLNRPLVAPEGYWTFEVNCLTSTSDIEDLSALAMKKAYPNPTENEIWIPVESTTTQEISLLLKDVVGRELGIIFDGAIQPGTQKYVLHTNHLSAGTYFIFLQSNLGVQTQKFVKK